MEMSKARETANFLRTFSNHGKGTEMTITAYDDPKNAMTYHGAKQYTGYTGPRYAADMVAAVTSIKSRENVAVLDFGAGTGHVGEELQKRGFKNLTAMDGSKGMLDICKTTGYYKEYIQFTADGNSKFPVEDAVYDIVAMSGVIIPEHAPPSCLRELARIVKPGGYIINVYRKLSDSFSEQLQSEMKNLQDEGKVSFYGTLNFHHYNNDSCGLVDVLLVL